jgi:hypothetical protein
MHNRLLLAFASLATTLAAPLILAADKPKSDAEIIAALDTAYQAAVEKNDWQGMDKILHKDFILVLSKGKVVSRNELLDWARQPEIFYDKQVEVPGTQTVRMWGPETATVTALLWLKGTWNNEKKDTFEYKLWFTDTYVKTKAGWKYALGQASEHVPE